jgi:hypothetical protein
MAKQNKKVETTLGFSDIELFVKKMDELMRAHKRKLYAEYYRMTVDSRKQQSPQVGKKEDMNESNCRPEC